MGRDPMFLAEHGGYLVVAPNITGSSGYSKDFVDGTRRSFAGAPYEDLKHGFEYLQRKPPLSYIDTSRAELGRQFRALVSCNGIFNIMSYLSSSSDAQQAVMHEMGGPPLAEDSETFEELKR
ncbi:hypothetical protein BJY01DRAFT_250092 [Aspergillus pseudoustus]|uniref:Peptidase S9 prolyl oligopeptidase catalytic domain-containing protein n=1 Tax=Aspergillus pseudoustus TaxID=1810923 RepID=A0ABR4JMJ6_9EURO